MLETLPHTNGHAAVATRTVAICGTASSSRAEIPKQPDDVELWGLNKSYTWMPRYSRWFDMHRWGTASYHDNAYREWMRQQRVPIFRHEALSDVPCSVEFPMEAVLRRPQGGQYQRLFTSTIAYMMALAIAEGVSEIRLLGVDMATNSEYAYQRDACLYWKGVAEGRGIEVYLPDVSPLAATSLYGVDDPALNGSRAATDWLDRVKTQMEVETDDFIKTMEAKVEEFKRNRDACRGAIQMGERIRGGVIVPTGDSKQQNNS